MDYTKYWSTDQWDINKQMENVNKHKHTKHSEIQVIMNEYNKY